MKQPSAVGLFTDFGGQDHYLGQIYSALHARINGVPVYNLMNSAPQYNPKASAYLLAAILRDVSRNTVVMAVVDPGVGSERQALIIETERHILIGPDNGLLTIASRSFNSEISVIDWRPDYLSSSFHGRDLFAPIVAMIINGEPVPSHQFNRDEMIGSDWADNLYEVVHVDKYGNLITGIQAETVSSDSRLMVAGKSVENGTTFSSVSAGKLFWYENSSGLVEIACNQGSANKHLKTRVGSEISVV